MDRSIDLAVQHVHKLMNLVAIDLLVITEAVQWKQSIKVLLHYHYLPTQETQLTKVDLSSSEPQSRYF